ncbi:hypothetical protein HMPREF9151_02566 [Hoylesella saccharolytica F0055]|uniref:Uncharacterized protein n=1 Tax=Hoylesella saccharolytica F0055 TaxID=1127699 RepID=L1MYG0_9BACT|nr:hypothetical protein HMPREF9151_02566 [Hoylesella saccharolytica F0055]
MKKVICNEKRKSKVFSNVKKVTNCKQLKRRQRKKVQGWKMANVIIYRTQISK